MFPASLHPDFFPFSCFSLGQDWFIAMRLIMLEGYYWICRLITTYSKHLSTIILHINYGLHMPLFLSPTEVLSWWLWTYFHSFSYVTNIIIEYNSLSAVNMFCVTNICDKLMEQIFLTKCLTNILDKHKWKTKCVINICD